MFENYGLDPGCRVYVSFKDVIYDRELTDFGMIINNMLIKNEERSKEAFNILLKIPGIDKFLLENNDLIDQGRFRNKLIQYVLEKFIMKRVYIDGIFDDDTTKNLYRKPSDVIMLVMSDVFFTKKAINNSSLYFLYDDEDKRYIPEGLTFFKDKLIHIEEFTTNPDKYIPDDNSVYDIIVGVNYIAKYKDNIIPRKNVKIIMPVVDAMMAEKLYQYTPTITYTNGITNIDSNTKK